MHAPQRACRGHRSNIDRVTMMPLQSHPRPSRRPRRAAGDILLSERMFSAALDRELERSDRLDEDFVLLVVKREDTCDDATWRHVIDATIAVTQPTDVLGWLADHCSL